MTNVEARILEALDYDPSTGLFRYRRTGETCGSLSSSDGYVRVCVDSVQYLAHRVAFLFMTGCMPPLVDHKDRVRHNNAWDNLREATRLGNAQNASVRKDNSSGYRGVSWNDSKEKWHAYIYFMKKQIHLGFFDHKEDAIEARKVAVVKYHKQFANEA